MNIELITERTRLIKDGSYFKPSRMAYAILEEETEKEAEAREEGRSGDNQYQQFRSPSTCPCDHYGQCPCAGSLKLRNAGKTFSPYSLSQQILRVRRGREAKCQTKLPEGTLQLALLYRKSAHFLSESE